MHHTSISATVRVAGGAIQPFTTDMVPGIVKRILSQMESIRMGGLCRSRDRVAGQPRTRNRGRINPPPRFRDYLFQTNKNRERRESVLTTAKPHSLNSQTQSRSRMDGKNPHGPNRCVAAVGASPRLPVKIPGKCLKEIDRRCGLAEQQGFSLGDYKRHIAGVS